MNKVIILAILGLTLNLNCSGQSDKILKEKILGSWMLNKTESKEEFETLIDITSPEETKDNESEETRDVVLFFQDNGKLDFYESGEKYVVNYSISDSILQMGNRTYKIKKISDKKLIMDESEFSLTTDYYIRISDKEEVLKKYK